MTNDSIKRILDDAGKSALDYWKCEDHDGCERCPAEVIDSCSNAQKNDLVNRTRALYERQLPEGVEWPRFEDGELVQIGDAYVKANGRAGIVTALYLRAYDGVPVWGIGKGGGRLLVKPEERVKRPEPADTQEKIDADAGKSFCEYFGHGSGICKEGGVCEAHGSSEPCRALMIRDLLRRQRELCERGAR